MLPTATAFLLLVVAPIALLITGWVVWPLLRHGETASPAADDALRATNAAVVRERRAQLDKDLAGLPAESPERDRLILEFSNTALADLAPEARQVARSGRNWRWVAAAAMAILLLGGPLAFYRLAGVPGIVDPAFVRSVAPTSIEELVAELERRLAADPGSAEGWMLLGRTRMSLGEFPKAIDALERALALDSGEPELAAQIRVDLADALAQSTEHRLAGRPWALIQEALARDPVHPKALALAGAYQVSRNDNAAALGYWKRLLALLPADSAQHQQIAGYVADLESGRRPGSGTAAAAAEGPVLRGTVTLDPPLQTDTGPDETVFIVVRGVDAAGEPVGPPAAATRIRVADLPFTFAFSDREAMGPMARLSGQTRVVVIARVSRTGTASAAPGDLEGRSATVEPAATGVQVRIDRRLP